MKQDALQTAIFERLESDLDLVAMLSQAWGLPAVFSDIQQIEGEDNSFFPYISFGPDIGNSWDTKSDFGASVSVQIDVWSRQADYTEAKAIMSQVHERLHYQPLFIEGAQHVYTRVDSATTSRDPDGKTRRGLMLLTVVYDEI